MFYVFFLSAHSPVWAVARISSAGVSAPGVPSPRGPPEAAAGTAGDPAEGERGGSTEREREASGRKKKRRAEGGGELLKKIQKNLQHPQSMIYCLSPRIVFLDTL